MANDDSALLDLIGEDNIVQAVSDWAESNEEDFLQLIANQFDVGGTQQAASASPTGVKAVTIHNGTLVAAVTCEVTYKNPIDSEDTEMSAENVTDETFVLALDGVVTGLDLTDVAAAPEGVLP